MISECPVCGFKPEHKWETFSRWCTKCKYDLEDEYNHLSKQQKMVVRSAPYALTRPDGSYAYLWITMIKRAMRESNYMGTIITFDYEIAQHYMDSMVIYAMDYITRVRNISFTGGYLDFASGARIHIKCYKETPSDHGMHVQQLLIDPRISIKKPTTEIFRNS